MNLKRTLLVDFVQYRGSGAVLINVTPQVRDPDTDEVLGVKPTENVHTDQDALAKLAGDGVVWGDAEVEAEILAATMPKTHYEPIPEEEQEKGGPTERQVTEDVLRYPEAVVVWK